MSNSGVQRLLEKNVDGLIQAINKQEDIIICRHCGKPEYEGEMRWLSGRCSCRSCYKFQWQDANKKEYNWTDLEGERPTVEEYQRQLCQNKWEE